jgi:HEAT repeat protein
MSDSPPTELKALKQGIVRRISLGLNLLALYPHTHPEVQGGIHNLLLHLEPLFSVEKELWIGIEPKGWVIQGLDLSKENIQFGGTARELHRRGVSALALYSGLTEVSLSKFFQIATLPVAEIESRGGLIKIASELSLPFINLFAVDYKKLFSEENVLEENTLLEKNNWKTLIDQFIASGGNILTLEQTGTKSQTSEELAMLLNRVYKTGGSEEVDKMISFLKLLGSECLTEGKQKRPKIEKFCQLISQLNPNILNQTVSTITREEKKFDQFEDRLLETFNIFLDSSSKLEKITPVNPDKESSTQEAHQIHDLFQKRSKDLSFSETYKGSLSKMVDQIEPLINKDTPEYSDQEKYTLELSPDKTTNHTLRVILDLLELEKNPSDYSKMVKQLPQYFEKVFRSRDLDLIYETFSFLDRHSVLKEENSIRSAAEEQLYLLFSGGVVLELAEQCLNGQQEDAGILEKLLMRLDRSMVITQLRLLGRSLKEEKSREKLFSLLSKLMYSDISLLEKDLSSNDTQVVRDAIRILRAMPNESCADLLASLLNHTDGEIRHLALDALMDHGTQRSLEYLLPLLKLSNKDLFLKAAKAIARHAKRPILEKVQRFLNSQDMFERNYEKKLDLIAALGEEKNGHAVALLVEIFNQAPFFREKKNTAFCAAILNALAKIATNDAMMALTLLSKKGNTLLQMTGNILLEKQDQEKKDQV